MTSKLRLFTSESVTEGHPDKICDQISDAVLDAILEQDRNGRVAVEVMAAPNNIILSGEINTFAEIDVDTIVRDVLKGIGYDDAAIGMDYRTVIVTNLIGQQSAEIAGGVFSSLEARLGDAKDDIDTQGAGDQGIMFGYATNETVELMPLPILLSHRIAERLAHLRKDGTLGFLRPDGKTQVTVAYDEYNIPTTVDTVVISTQHAPGITQEFLREQVIENVILPIINDANLGDLQTSDTKFIINPGGDWQIGGPASDAGLTGRKIIVDTYGGAARHGGGAFCFAAGTPVKTIDGHKAIESLQEGDLVWTENEKTGFASLKPINLITVTEAENSNELLEIELENGEIIRVTDNHEIWTQRGWVTAGELTLEDEFTSFNQLRVRAQPTMIEHWLINEGLTVEEAKLKQSELQKSRSPLTVEYWTTRGYSTEAAESLIAQEQRRRSPASPDYYEAQGLTPEEAIEQVRSHQKSTLDNWTQGEISEMRGATQATIENLIAKYGGVDGTARYEATNRLKSDSAIKYVESLTYDERMARHSRPGELNPMHGVTPPHTAGSGISGYHNGNLFRSLLELSGFLKAESEGLEYRANEVKDRSQPEVVISFHGEDGSKRRYVPDVLILNEDGNVSKIVEIKSDEYSEEFESKISESPGFLSELDRLELEFEIWIHKKDLWYDRKTYKQLLQSNEIEIHSNKSDRFLNFVN